MQAGSPGEGSGTRTNQEADMGAERGGPPSLHGELFVCLMLKGNECFDLI